MATLDKLASEKKGGKKASSSGESDMSNAVARTEKIRDWVSFEKL